jgi:hypothetical protein
MQNIKRTKGASTGVYRVGVYIDERVMHKEIPHPHPLNVTCTFKLRMSTPRTYFVVSVAEMAIVVSIDKTADRKRC